MYLNRRANSTHICTHQGTRGQYPALAAGGHRTSCSSQTSSTPSRSPGAHEAEGRLRSLCTADTPHPWFTLSHFSWHPFSYIPQSRALFSPLTSPTAPSGGTDQKPKTFSQTSILQKVTKESLALQNTSLEARSLERDQVSNHIVIIC